MGDNKNFTGSPDNDLISLTQDYEVRDWCNSFGCTEQELRACVKETGSHSVKKVAQCLKNKGLLKNGY